MSEATTPRLSRRKVFEIIGASVGGGEDSAAQRGYARHPGALGALDKDFSLPGPLEARREAAALRRARP